jgi:hypothetical protein
MNERYFRSLAALFQRHGLISDISETDIGKAKELPLVGNLVRVLIPNYVLFEDSECIYQGDDLVKLTEEIAKITNGNWKPKDIKADFDRGDNRATIEFSSQGENFNWEFEQYGDYINDGYFNALERYAENNLEGKFFQFSSMGQEFCLLYLPDPISTDFSEFQVSFAPTSDELAEFVATVDDWAEKGYTGWYLVREVLREMNLRNINSPTEDGSYVISIVRKIANAGSGGAKELEFALIDLGADRYPD